MKTVWPHLPGLAGRYSPCGCGTRGLSATRGDSIRARAGGDMDDAVIAGAMLWQVLHAGPISYAMGGWPPPWGIEYRVDVLNGFVLLLISAVGAVIMPFARRSVAFEVDGAAGLVLLHVPALPGRPARRHDHRRRLQCLRLSRNLIAFHLCADRARKGPASAARRVPVPDHGHGRGNLLRHRCRLALHSRPAVSTWSISRPAWDRLGPIIRVPSWRLWRS